MVNLLEILPVLALVLAIVCIPLLGDPPSDRAQSSRKPPSEPDSEEQTGSPVSRHRATKDGRISLKFN
jgi:hypothetical protein